MHYDATSPGLRIGACAWPSESRSGATHARAQCGRRTFMGKCEPCTHDARINNQVQVGKCSTSRGPRIMRIIKQLAWRHAPCGAPRARAISYNARPHAAPVPAWHDSQPPLVRAQVHNATHVHQRRTRLRVCAGARAPCGRAPLQLLPIASAPMASCAFVRASCRHVQCPPGWGTSELARSAENMLRICDMWPA